MTKNTIQNHNGKLSVKSAWKPDYDKPIMGRVVWESSHDYEDRFCDYYVEAGAEDNGFQIWIMHSPFGGRFTFKTPVIGAYELGEPIKPPRKRKDQQNPWRWEAGEWVRTAK